MILAIDPGANGGIAYSLNGVVTAMPMPDTEGDIRDLIMPLLVYGPEVWIEQVGGFVKGSPAPGSAMFNFGRNVGFLHGLLAAGKARVRVVTPQKWQKELSLGDKKSHKGNGWKNHLKERAQQLYPDLKVTLKTADALLILEHARRQK